MKEKIEKKIEAIVDYIIGKPEEKITADDYMILASEVRDIRFREAESIKERKNEERLERLMGMANNPINLVPGKITPIHPADGA